MMPVKKLSVYIGMLLVLTMLISSCYKKEIEFGEDPENNYTKIAYIDTVAVSVSTVQSDSFATNGAGSLLLGKYKDPYLGTITARPFFQLGLPTEAISIPSTAIFDSLIFIIRTNNYYYGDTTKTQTIYVNELSQAISYSYNDQLYNTSSVATKPTPLGSRTLSIRPLADDSITIRLNNTKGQELFSKMQQLSTDVTDADDFLAYFKGINLSVGPNDTTVVFGLATGTTMTMRVVYHLTTPAIVDKFIDFPMQANTYTFNQIVADRSGTVLPSGTVFAEYPSSQTSNLAFTQEGTGLFLKLTFPSLRDVIRNDDIVRLLNADLIIRPAALSFDKHKFKLPSNLHLATTDGSNIIGDRVLNTLGEVLYASPVIDEIYGENNYYHFNITSYINSLLNTPGSEDNGFFLQQGWTLSSMNLDRAIVNNSSWGNYRTQLALTVLVVNK
jgi:hypothetical protein